MSKRFLDPFLLLFAGWLFVLLPMVRIKSAIDPGLAIRFLLTAAPIALLCLAILFKPKFKLKYSQSFKQFGFLLLISIVWMCVSALQSLNAGDALWEILRISTLHVFVLVSYFILQKRDNMFSVLSRFSLLAILIFSVYAMLQLIPVWQKTGLSDIASSIDLSLSSSLGNKNNFAEVMVMILPLILIGLFSEQGLWKMCFIIALLITLSWILILQSSSAWLAIAIASVVCLFLKRASAKNFIVESEPRTKSNKVILFSGALFFIILTVFIISSSGFFTTFKNKSETVLQYIDHPELIDSTSSINNNSVFERVLLWRNTLRMIKDHKLLGVGINNWKLFMPMYGVGGTPFINSGLLTFEHPHNDYLLVLAEQGPIGLLLYILFFIFLLRIIFKSIRSSSDQEYINRMIFLGFGLISFMLLSMFAFPRLKFYVMLILMLYAALILSLAKDDKASSTVSNRMKLLFLFLCIIITSVGSAAAWYRLNGELHTKEILRAQFAKNFARMLREADKAESLFYPLDYTGTPIRWYKGMAYFYSGNIPEAVRLYEDAVQINPYHLRVLNDLATAYEKSGESKKAIKMYQKALMAAPFFTETLLNLSATYFNTGEIDSALAVINRVQLVKISYRDKQNYELFLNAILIRKAEALLKPFYNQESINKLLLARSEKNDLIEIYTKANRNENIFLEYIQAK